MQAATCHKGGRLEEDVIDAEGIGPDSATAVSHIASGTQKSFS